LRLNGRIILVPDWSWLKSTSHKQLELEIGPLEESLTQYLANPPTTSTPDTKQKAKDALAYLTKSKAALSQRQVQNAWSLFYKAELLQYNLKSDDEVAARAGRILFENTRMLSEGSKQNVRKLIGKDSGNGSWDLQSPVVRERVIEARRIIQDYYNNKYIYLDVTMQLLSILAVIVAGLSVIVAATLTWVPTTVSAAPSSLLFWVTIGLLGGIGGAISGLLGLKESFALDSDMPERVLNKWVTIAKPVLGFGAAIVIAIFVFAGFVEVANIQVSTYLIYALAFVSGFSERLIIGAVASRLPA
jgi:hypothetical protein